MLVLLLLVVVVVVTDGQLSLLINFLFKIWPSGLGVPRAAAAAADARHTLELALGRKKKKKRGDGKHVPPFGEGKEKTWWWSIELAKREKNGQKSKVRQQQWEIDRERKWPMVIELGQQQQQCPNS